MEQNVSAQCADNLFCSFLGDKKKIKIIFNISLPHSCKLLLEAFKRILFTYRYIKRLISPFIFTIICLMHSSCRFSPFFNCRQSFVRLLNQNKFIICFNFFLFISKSIGMPFFGQFPISGFYFFLGYPSFQFKSFQCMFSPRGSKLEMKKKM